MHARVFLLLAFTLGLRDAPECSLYANPFFADIVPMITYPTEVNLVTPKGVLVDAREVAVDVEQIDKLVDEFEECYGKPVERCGFNIKVVEPDIVYPEQAFWCMIGETGFCHGLIQYPSTVVVTPNMNALKHELIHALAYRLHGDPLFRCE